MCDIQCYSRLIIIMLKIASVLPAKNLNSTYFQISFKAATAKLLVLCSVSFILIILAATLTGFTVSLHPSAREVLVKKYILT